MLVTGLVVVVAVAGGDVSGCGGCGGDLAGGSDGGGNTGSKGTWPAKTVDRGRRSMALSRKDSRV